MKAYAFSESKIYLGPVTMQRDPLESKAKKRDVWLLPTNATLVAPPTNELPEGSFYFWTGMRWDITRIPELAPEPGFMWAWTGANWVITKDQTYVAPEPVEE